MEPRGGVRRTRGRLRPEQSELRTPILRALASHPIPSSQRDHRGIVSPDSAKSRAISAHSRRYFRYKRADTIRYVTLYTTLRSMSASQEQPAHPELPPRNAFEDPIVMAIASTVQESMRALKGDLQALGSSVADTHRRVVALEARPAPQPAPAPAAVQEAAARAIYPLVRVPCILRDTANSAPGVSAPRAETRRGVRAHTQPFLRRELLAELQNTHKLSADTAEQWCRRHLTEVRQAQRCHSA